MPSRRSPSAPPADPSATHVRSDPVYVVKAQLFRVLGHPLRIRILELLRDGERTVGDLQAELGIDSSGTSTEDGAGYVFGLAPQTVQVNVLDTGHTCTLGTGFGWTSTTGTLSAPVIANELTLVSATCQ